MTNNVIPFPIQPAQPIPDRDAPTTLTFEFRQYGQYIEYYPHDAVTKQFMRYCGRRYVKHDDLRYLWDLGFKIEVVS